MIHHLLLKTDLGSLKSYVDKLDIDKLKNIPTNSNNLKNKVDKLDVHKLISVPVHLCQVTENILSLKKMYIMLSLQILKIKRLILLV